MKAFSLLVFIMLLCCSTTDAQDLEQIGGSPFEVSGNISVGSSLYHAEGRDNRRSPFAYFISANPTFTIYGIDIPVSLVYRDQQGSISNPFNRYTISPRYKWAQLHLGNTNLTMNPYTLSGQLIKGAGLELTPGHLRFAVVAGELENPLAQLDTIVEGAELLNTYKRNAKAAKLGYGSERNFFELSAFKAKDDINTIDRTLVDPRLVKPEENLVLGASFGISPVKWLTLKVNAAASAHTANQETLELIETENFSQVQEDYGDLITLNFSSKLQFAGDASVNFRFKNFGFGAEYKRVDPLYKSLGTFYFLEDYENILGKVNFNLARSKIRFQGRAGIQRNNLNNLRAVTNTRQILNVNLTVAPSRSFAITGRYSNFQTDRAPGLISVNDSLRFARATANYGLTPRVSFGSKDRRSTITASVNYQNLEDLLNEETTGRTIDNYNANLTYSLSIRPSRTSISISALANENIIVDRETRRLGGNIRLSQKLAKKKLTLTTTAGYLQNYLNGLADGSSITARVGIRYRVKKKYNASVNVNYLNRSGLTAFQEFRGTVKFTYLLPKKTS